MGKIWSLLVVISKTTTSTACRKLLEFDVLKVLKSFHQILAISADLKPISGFSGILGFRITSQKWVLGNPFPKMGLNLPKHRIWGIPSQKCC